jgi:hypothetical protein
MRRNQWAAAVLAVLLFCCGAAVGALGERYYNARVVNADSKQPYVSEMRSRLKLTPAQVNELETILDETKAQYKAVRDSYRPAMLKIRQAHIARVKSILTPAQIPIYEQLVAERERRAKEQEERERQQEQKRAAARQQHPTQ